MKKLLLLLLATASLTAQAQHTRHKKTVRKAKKTHIQKVSFKKYHSKNGLIKAHEIVILSSHTKRTNKKYTATDTEF